MDGIEQTTFGTILSKWQCCGAVQWGPIDWVMPPAQPLQRTTPDVSGLTGLMSMKLSVILSAMLIYFASVCVCGKITQGVFVRIHPPAADSHHVPTRMCSSGYGWRHLRICQTVGGKEVPSPSRGFNMYVGLKRGGMPRRHLAPFLCKVFFSLNRKSGWVRDSFPSIFMYGGDIYIKCSSCGEKECSMFSWKSRCR